MTAIVILAAGASTRMGSPKQNLVYKGKTLLQHAIANALSVTERVMVVLGANHGDIEYSIKDQPVNILYNSKWPAGMATSITLAVEILLRHNLIVKSVIFMLCDQPFVDKILLERLITVARDGNKGIVASAYNDTLGVPTLFQQKYFLYLLALKGDEGAKKLLLQHADDVLPVPFPLGGVDIDTVKDWEKLTNTNLS